MFYFCNMTVSLNIVFFKIDQESLLKIAAYFK